jgi:8-hydroxy-5-deazaflavin:NADPH oxidoreductase
VKIGILGSGQVAQALGSGFLSRGYEVMMGTRDPAKLAEWRNDHPKARVGSFAEAASFGEIDVLATLGEATVEIVTGVGADRFAGKVVIDATNPLRFDDKGPHLNIGFDDSQGERVQRALPQALVVKAFNMVGNAYMVDPKFNGGPPTMLVAGNDDGAKKAVVDILTSFGWESADLGGIESSRYLEAMCMAWVLYGMQTQTWHHAFKLLR